MKKCSKCRELKTIHDFNKDKSKKDGLYYQCKVCSRLKNKKYRDNNKESLSNYSKKIVRELKPCYIAQKLNITMKDDYILSNLMELKKIQILTNRLLKN